MKACSLRNRLVLPLLLYTCLLLIGTLWPLNFRADGAFLTKKIASVEWLPFTYRCPVCGFDFKDKILNLGMFMPFGFFLSLFLSGGKPNLRGILSAGEYGFLFSLTIEIAQLFLPDRTTQASDLVLNTLGSAGGAACAVLYARCGNYFFPSEKPAQKWLPLL